MRDSSFILTCLAIVAVEALAILALSIEGRHQVLGATDARQYEQYARNLADRGVFSAASGLPYAPSVFRTPAYPVFLALLHLIGGNSLLLVRAAQFALVWVTGVLLYFLAAAVSTSLIARVSTVLWITYLPALWFAREHISDTLATAMAVATILVFVRARRTDARRPMLSFALVGLLAGLASLVRPELGAVVAVLAIGTIVWPGGAARVVAAQGAALMVVVFLLTLVPWTLRNYGATHRVLPFGTATGSSLYPSVLQWNGTLSMAFTNADFHRDALNVDPVLAPVISRDAVIHASPARLEVDVNDALVTAARHLAGNLAAGDVMKRLPRRLAYLWSVGDEPPAGAYTFWHDVDRLQYAILTLLGLAGMLLWSRGREEWARWWPLIAFAATATALHMVFHVQPRYTLPARPMLLVFAAAAFVWLLDRLIMVLSGPRPLTLRRG